MVVSVNISENKESSGWENGQPLFIKILNNTFSYSVSKYEQNSIYTVSFNESEVIEWAFKTKK